MLWARSRASAPASTTGCSTPATRRSATSPRRSRTCCRRRRATSDARPGRLGRGAPAAAARRSRRQSRRERVAAYWDELDAAGRFLLNKLIGGGFRVGVSKLLVQRALAEGAGVDAKLVAQRMMGYTDGRATPSAERYRAAHRVGPTPAPPTSASRIRSSSPIRSTLPDGRIRRQARRRRPTGSSNGSTTASARRSIKRAGQVWIWSRGEELVTRALPRDRRARARSCPTAPCSTARSSSGRTAGSRRSTCCSSASAARR